MKEGPKNSVSHKVFCHHGWQHEMQRYVLTLRRVESKNGKEEVTMEQRALTRREFLVLTGSGIVAAGALGPRAVLAQSTTIRQGYQTNIWGMPTYYLLRSGALEKRGLKFEEFAVPSGNLTMQQMVARQVDLGTYAGQSFVTGYDKGGLVAIAQIEHVGKTARVMARKELKVTKVAELKGMKIGNQVGSSTGNTFVDIIAPQAGLKKEDYQEVKMNAVSYTHLTLPTIYSV